MTSLRLNISALCFASALALPLVAQAAPVLVTDLTTGTASSDLELVGALGSSAVFVDRTNFDVHKLWISDGTKAGTVTLPWEDDLDVNGSAVTVGNRLYFGVSGFDTADGIWVTDGTAAGTKRAATTGGLTKLVVVGTRVIAYERNSGDIAGDVIAIDTTTGAVSTAKDFVNLKFDGFAKLNGNAFFIDGRYDSTHLAKLTKTDGTAAGTSVVKTLGTDDMAEQLVATPTKLLFLTRTTVSTQLWASDGTEAGTIVVGTFPGKNPADNAIELDVDSLTAVGDLAYFNKRPTVGGGPVELWRSDGTVAGTFSLGGVLTSPESSAMLGVLNGRALFEGHNAATGHELWQTDGTLAGTALLDDLRTGKDGTSPSQGLTWGNEVVFAGWTPGSNQWFRTDGTSAGTKALFTGAPPGGRPFGLAGDALVAGKNFFFLYEDDTNGLELWVDGTGTNPPGSSSSSSSSGSPGSSSGSSGSSSSGGASSSGGDDGDPTTPDGSGTGALTTTESGCAMSPKGGSPLFGGLVAAMLLVLSRRCRRSSRA
jgi:ELWxxDGT repeat protein